MKRFSKFFTVILAILMIVSCLTLVGCSQKGEYHFKSMTYEEDGLVFELEAGESFMGFTLSEEFLTITLEKDGTAIFKGLGETSTGTWSKVDGKHINLNGKEIFCNGKTIEIEVDGMKLVLEK